MLKIAVAAMMVAAVASVLAFPVPKLDHLRHPKAAAAGGKILVQRCATLACGTPCNTIIEIPTEQCHPDEHGQFFNRGEILHVNNNPPVRTCFRETIYDNKGGLACQGPVIASAPRECGQCYPEPFPLGTFLKFSGCGTANFSVSRGCDFGCNNCDVQIPLVENQCITMPHHTKYLDFAFMNGVSFPCGGSGWQEIIADHFISPVCDFQPDFVNRQWASICYTEHNQGIQYVVA